MADNTKVSDDPTIAADEIGAVKYQRTKVVWGVDGVAVDASATDPLPVDIQNELSLSLTEYDTDEAVSGATTGIATMVVRDDELATLTEADDDYTTLRVDSQGKLWTRAVIPDADGNALTFAKPVEITATPSVSTTAYDDNENLDGTIISMAAATASPSGSAWVTHMWIQDKAGNVGVSGVGLEVYFLNADLTTIPGERSAFTLPAGDGEKIRQVLSTADGTTYDYGSGTWTTVDAGRARPFKLAAGTTLYLVVKVLDPDTDTPTWAANDIIIGAHILED
jgi:hypothetical protein